MGVAAVVLWVVAVVVEEEEEDLSDVVACLLEPGDEVE
jgi:hypothetical protein